MTDSFTMVSSNRRSGGPPNYIPICPSLHPLFIIIIRTIPLAPDALRARLCNWGERERCKRPCSLTVFDKVNSSNVLRFVVSVVESTKHSKVLDLMYVSFSDTLYQEMEAVISS